MPEPEKQVLNKFTNGWKMSDYLSIYLVLWQQLLTSRSWHEYKDASQPLKIIKSLLMLKKSISVFFALKELKVLDVDTD